MKKNISVGIDIGTSNTKVVVTEEFPDGIKIIGFGTSQTSGLRHGYIVNKESVLTSLRKSISEAEKSSGIKIKQANIAIGGVGIGASYGVGSSVVSRADSIISKLDVEKAINEAEKTIDLKNKTMLHAYPVSFKIDGKEYPVRPEGIAGLKLEVKTLFITCFSQHLEDLISIVNDCGVKVLGFTASPIAHQNLLLTDLQKNFGCAVIDIGSETVSVAVFENNTLISLHVFEIGSLNITKDLALGLRITPEEAESIKLGVVSFQSVPKKKVDEIVEARLSDIFELVDKYFKKIGRSGLLPAGAVIVGGGANINSLESVAKNMLKIPIRKGFVDLPSSKGVIKDQSLLIAYSLASQNLNTKNKNEKSFVESDGEGVLSVIKNFFKQLMP